MALYSEYCGLDLEVIANQTVLQRTVQESKWVIHQIELQWYRFNANLLAQNVKSTAAGFPM